MLTSLHSPLPRTSHLIIITVVLHRLNALHKKRRRKSVKGSQWILASNNLAWLSTHKIFLKPHKNIWWQLHQSVKKDSMIVQSTPVLLQALLPKENYCKLWKPINSSSQNKEKNLSMSSNKKERSALFWSSLWFFSIITSSIKSLTLSSKFGPVTIKSSRTISLKNKVFSLLSVHSMDSTNRNNSLKVEWLSIVPISQL